MNYGAYTSFRVEDGAARGLDLHLERLRRASIELFGEAVPEARLLELMRAAMGARETCWLRVSLFSDEISNRNPTWVGRPRVMIGVFDPPPPLAGSLRLQVQRHERIAPHLKHAANMDLLMARRRARAEGFDDALFEDSEGELSEGTLWNIGFVQGNRVTWPRAPMLAGVTQRLIQAGLKDVGLGDETRDLDRSDVARGAFQSAFICNSATPACPVESIDGWSFEIDTDVINRLRTAWASQPCQPI